MDESKYFLKLEKYAKYESKHLYILCAIVAEFQIALDKVFFYVFFQKCSLRVKYSTQETIAECPWFDTRWSRLCRVFVSWVGDTECKTRQTRHPVFLGLHRLPWHSSSSGFPVVVGYFPPTNPSDHILQTQCTSSQRSSPLGRQQHYLQFCVGHALASSHMSYLSSQGQIHY
jgi:hypothetical protein